MLRKPAQIPYPDSTFPGANPQEGAGRLINCYAEQLGEASKRTGPAERVWRRSSGLSQHAITPQAGYRGGLLVNNLSYEVFSGNASTVDLGGNVLSLGAFPGTKKVSIARDQASPNPDIVSVDVDNGAYQLSGGGAPVFYNGGGNLPAPNSVCFQDGYFFFTIGDGRCFASALNALTQNSLTFITCNAKADVSLIRGIAFSGLLFLFTTGSCEIWQDAAIAAPAFPYSRLTVLETGLLQQAAIAGWETGFAELLWVGQDQGVYWLSPGSLAPVKVSTPDLERLIALQLEAGNLLEAGCYVAGGKKFWHLSSPSWTWEFNLATRKWNERVSLSGGIYGRWRATSGHPAFNRWLVGDTQSGNILFHDENNRTENGAVQLFRIESGPVKEFPHQVRIARADFDFDVGVGQAVGSFQMRVLGAAAGNNNVVRLTVNDTTRANNNDVAQIVGVTGTVEANTVGTPLKVIDATHIELPNIQFVNAYISGGVATDLTSPPGAINPSVAISCSKDGGVTFDVPSLRGLAAQNKTKRTRVSVKNRGLSGAQGVRWRCDVTDPVYTAFMGATMTDNPREVHP